MGSKNESNGAIGIEKRLNAIIRILLDEQFAGGKIDRQQQILSLHSVGFSPGEIGEIVGKKSKDVSSIIKRLEKKIKK